MPYLSLARLLTALTVYLLLSVPAQAGSLKLQSDDVGADQAVPQTFIFNGFGCSGENLSPALAWSGAPPGTKSYALTIYDPDAPTGSGWWHWVVVNLPAETHALPRGAGDVGGQGLPEAAQQIRTDFGTIGYGGPCPPEGDTPHRYIVTLYALDTPALTLPEGATAALAGFMIKAHALEETQLLFRYGR